MILGIPGARRPISKSTLNIELFCKFRQIFFQSLKKWGRNWKYLFYLPNTIASGLMSVAKKYEFAYLILLKMTFTSAGANLKREFSFFSLQIIRSLIYWSQIQLYSDVTSVNSLVCLRPNLKNLSRGLYPPKTGLN